MCLHRLLTLWVLFLLVITGCVTILALASRPSSLCIIIPQHWQSSSSPVLLHRVFSSSHAFYGFLYVNSIAHRVYSVLHIQSWHFQSFWLFESALLSFYLCNYSWGTIITYDALRNQHVYECLHRYDSSAVGIRRRFAKSDSHHHVLHWRH